MIAFSNARPLWLEGSVEAAALLICSIMLFSCSTFSLSGQGARLRDTASLIADVKAFGQTLGIEPTQALQRTAQDGPTLSMLWLWMQRVGTIAIRAPVDIRMAIGFNGDKEPPKLEQVYRVDGYSVYYRQGNEFADPRSVATMEFAEEPLVRRVKVILHEDLHGDENFALPWEVEEAIVTPLGSLAAVEYFRHNGDETNLANAVRSVLEERRLSRQLLGAVDEAAKIFALEQGDEAKQKVLHALAQFPDYQRQFLRQLKGQHAGTAVEAKLSHDLAYYRYFDEIAALAERAPDLRTLIADLKKLPHDANTVTTENFLGGLRAQYGSAAR